MLSNQPKPPYMSKTGFFEVLIVYNLKIYLEISSDNPYFAIYTDHYLKYKGAISRYSLLKMESVYKQQLFEAGTNVDKALDRFMGSEALYDKFLLKFIQDTCYKQLEDCIKTGNASEAFMQAHTMKGIAGNLEFESLLEILVPMTEQLRRGDMTMIKEKQEELKLRYEKLYAVIKGNH